MASPLASYKVEASLNDEVLQSIRKRCLDEDRSEYTDICNRLEDDMKYRFVRGIGCAQLLERHQEIITLM